MVQLKNSYPIAIDISDHDIYAAQFQQTRQGISIRGLFHRALESTPTPEEGPADTLIPVCREIKKNRRFHGKTAVIHLPGRHVNSFPITFEAAGNETLEEGIVRECRRHLSFPAEEAVIDYPSITDISSGKNRKFRVIVVAVRREVVDQYVKQLKRAGLSVAAIDFSLSSLLRLHNYLYSITDHPSVFCSIGRAQSLVTIVTKDSILAQRNLAWGMLPLLDRLQTNLELSGEGDQARGMLKKYGLHYDQQIGSESGPAEEDRQDGPEALEIYRTVFQILAPYVDVLVNEFYQITGYARSEIQNIRFQEICLYGQAAFINSLEQYLAKRLTIPTKCINPMTKFTLSDNVLLPDMIEGAPFALALGLAMRKVSWL